MLNEAKISQLKAEIDALKEEQLEPWAQREALALDAKVTPYVIDVPVVKTKPWEHQTRAFWFLFHKLGLGLPQPEGGALLAMDMGTGKTKVMIDVLNNSALRTVLITSPLSVVATWPEEIKTHGARVEGFRVCALPKGSVKKRAALAEQAWNAAAESGQVAVFVINHEAVWREPFKSFVLKRQWDLLICDESHRAKAPGGRLSKFLGVASSRFSARVGLTGTPMPKDHMDIYAQGRFIDVGVFGSSFTSHKARFGRWLEMPLKDAAGRPKLSKWGKPIVARKLIGVRNSDDLDGRLNRLAYRVEADDVLDLPPAVVVQRTCELSKEERDIYEELRREMVVAIDDGFITAGNALTKILRLQQIVQGYVQDEEGKTHAVGTSKRNLLRETLESLDKAEPAVVFCRFHTDLDTVKRVAEDLGRGVLELSGRVNQLEEFKDGGGPILAAQIQSGGVGVDLSRAAYTIYFSPTYDGGAYAQSLRRTRRPTKHHHKTFFYYHLVAENTIDVAVYQALRDKKKMTDAVLAGIRGTV